ncbi:MAG: DCC1-like thiol-disulfide oxidoreductase family protein [Myxococcota bacterium]
MIVDNPTDKTWIFWDGQCGFCRRAVDWLLGQVHDPDAYIARPYQTAPRPPMTQAIYDACPDAVHIVLPDGTVQSGGAACVTLLADSKIEFAAWMLCVPPLSWLVEPGYSFVANNRMILSKLMFRSGRGKPTKHDVGA